MDNKCCWVWLQSVLGIGGKASVDEILREFGTAENVYEASDMQRRISNVFDEKQIEKLNTKTIDEAVRVVEQCKRLGLGIVTPDDESYPEKLKDIGDIPLVLYVKGGLDCLKDCVSIAMVGSRKISP
ncbi:MAG: DNA-processing protein DprA, partial [Oscillospiraceae bacterium]|nr:DNA-processing protein DprA [Oscillospiraceae bacterium]